MADNNRSRPPTTEALRYAAGQNEDGLQFYTAWELDKAVAAFVAATQADPGNPEYQLNLARSYARHNNYAEAMQYLGAYLRIETDEAIASRFEQLFSPALDAVESSLIAHTRALDWPIPLTARGLHMWLEYRIALGRRPLSVRRPDSWAGALAYAVGKINLSSPSRAEIARQFGISMQSLDHQYTELVQVLDLMPADYRYFLGEENPLDELVATQNEEAAEMVAALVARFHDE